MGKSAGAAPDYKGAAEQQAQASQNAVNQQTQSNRPNQATNFASTQWTQGPNGEWTQNNQLSGGLGSAASGLMGQAAGLGGAMDWSQFGALGNGDQARQQAIDAAYKQATSRLDPMWDKREEAQRTQLLNQGLDPNATEAGKGAMSDLGTQRTDAYNSAMNSAIAQGQAAGDSVFRNNLMARQQQIAEALRQRSQPLDELSRLQGFGAMPGFQGAGMAQAPNYFGAEQAAGDWRMQDTAQQNQFYGDVLGGLFGLGGGVAGGAGAAGGFAKLFSDERMKDEVCRLPVDAIKGVPLATWVYKADPARRVHIGVIAQDLAKVSPRHVTTDGRGRLMVDYSFIGGAA